MKFSQLAAGKRALKAVAFTTLNGDEARCSLRPLMALDDATALERAREFAIKRGLKEPRDGDPLYELGKAVHTVLLAAVDSDAPEQPFFDGGEDQILANLDLDRIFLVREWQRGHQDDCAPGPTKMSADEFIAAVYQVTEAAAGGDLPFFSWRRDFQESFLRSLASLYWSSLQGKSPSGPDFASSPTVATA